MAPPYIQWCMAGKTLLNCTNLSDVLSVRLVWFFPFAVFGPMFWHLLVGAFGHSFFFPFSWECHHPNWWTPSFFRGVGIPLTRPCWFAYTTILVSLKLHLEWYNWMVLLKTTCVPNIKQVEATSNQPSWSGIHNMLQPSLVRATVQLASGASVQTTNHVSWDFTKKIYGLDWGS